MGKVDNSEGDTGCNIDFFILFHSKLTRIRRSFAMQPLSRRNGLLNSYPGNHCPSISAEEFSRFDELTEKQLEESNALAKILKLTSINKLFRRVAKV